MFMTIKTKIGDVKYKIDELDFTNVACDIEDYGVNVMDLFTDGKDIKGFSMCRAIIGVLTGEKDKQKAGKMLTEHLKCGGTLDDIFNAFAEAMKSAGFGETEETTANSTVTEPTEKVLTPVQVIENT